MSNCEDKFDVCPDDFTIRNEIVFQEKAEAIIDRGGGVVLRWPGHELYVDPSPSFATTKRDVEWIVKRLLGDPRVCLTWALQDRIHGANAPRHRRHALVADAPPGQLLGLCRAADATVGMTVAYGTRNGHGFQAEGVAEVVKIADAIPRFGYDAATWRKYQKNARTYEVEPQP